MLKRTLSAPARMSSPLSTPSDPTLPLPPFLLLPLELRYQIYCWLFGSTRLTHGTDLTRPPGTQLIPTRNALAILQTCSQVYEEAREMWVGKVLFRFETLPDMLNKVMSLKHDIRCRIRHVSSGFWPLYINRSRDSIDASYGTGTLMTLLQSLQLNTFTLFGTNTTQS